jgi:hypothetical protein
LDVFPYFTVVITFFEIIEGGGALLGAFEVASFLE